MTEKRKQTDAYNKEDRLYFDSKNAIMKKQENSSCFEIEFYEDPDGISEIWDYLEELRIRSLSNKDARIRFNQIALSIELLQQKGTGLPANISKHLEDEIWELRPGSCRILYYYYGNRRFVLLHYFRKKTQKTPKREIMKAKKKMFDYRCRHKEAEQ